MKVMLDLEEEECLLLINVLRAEHISVPYHHHLWGTPVYPKELADKLIDALSKHRELERLRSTMVTDGSNETPSDR